MERKRESEIDSLRKELADSDAKRSAAEQKRTEDVARLEGILNDLVTTLKSSKQPSEEEAKPV